MKKLKLLWLLPLLLAVVFVMCKKDQEEVVNNEAELAFNFSFVDEGGLKDGTPPCADIDADFVRVNFSDGSSYLLDVFYLGSGPDRRPYTQTIKFDLGELDCKQVSVTSFVVYVYDYSDPDNVLEVAVAATPNDGGQYAQWIFDPLPLSFDVCAFEKNEVEIEVLCVEEQVYENFGYDWFMLEELVIRWQCFFGDICIKDLNFDLYANSPYALINGGVIVHDMIAITKVEVYRVSTTYPPLSGDPETLMGTYSNIDDFENPDLATEFFGGPLCVPYADYLNWDDVFKFKLYVYVHGGSGFYWLLLDEWTTNDDDGIPEDPDGLGITTDGIVDFVLGSCVIEADYIYPPYISLPNTVTWNGVKSPPSGNGRNDPGYGTIKLTNPDPSGTYDLPIDENLPAYCVDLQNSISFGGGVYNNAVVLSSLYPELMPVTSYADFTTWPWGEINWLYNHLYYWPDADSWDIQYAFWHLLPIGTSAYNGVGSIGPVDPVIVDNMVAAAQLNSDFVPMPGQYAAIAFFIDEPTQGQFEDSQMTFVQIDP